MYIMIGKDDQTRTPHTIPHTLSHGPSRGWKEERKLLLLGDTKRKKKYKQKRSEKKSET